jgi:ABC-type antimicrobial peptide transport system permease subunit
MVVNETLARKLWGTDDPLGRRVWSGTFDKKPYVVVGVVRDAPYQSLRERADPFFFGSMEPRDGARVLVRTQGPATSLARAAKASTEGIDATLQVAAVPVAAGVEGELRAALEAVQVTGMAGALALLLAAIGIAAVTSQVVVDRTHEIGVRIALGARGRDAVRLLVAKGLRPVAVGFVLGAVATVLAARGLRSVLYGLSPADPIAFGGAAFVLLAVAALAAYVPARRASRIDPIVALRAE